jgi:nucleoside-diphosphate-sugar epimerase
MSRFSLHGSSSCGTGYQLAKTLQANPKITSITILQDEACDDTKEPFNLYMPDLPDVEVIQVNFSYDQWTVADMQGVLGGRDVKFDYIWDNASKNAEGPGKLLCDCAKNWDPKLYTYVSSAGMYQPTNEFPMPETTPVKESAGQNLFEQYAVEIGLPLVTFRPQYIYGPKSNKYDYIDWYFDRLVRELPLPIPGDGTQKVSLTNCEDVASLLSSVLDNEEAAKEQRYFNCGTDQLVTYDEVAYMCAKAAGVDADKVMIEHYDHEKFGKAKFPFRMNDFYVAPDMVKEKLGWDGPTHSLSDDLTWYYDGYKARGGASKKMSLIKDREITIGSKASYENIYDKYE